jgi:SAM-dependent methyltransferase
VLGRDPLIPPKRLLRYGRADFVERGDAALGVLRELGGLVPGDRVLDLGCGPGGLARPLSAFLGGGGSYEGLDVDGRAIGWCRRAYGRRHRHARFLRADVFHPRLHPGGAHRAAEYRFPYDDASFDVVAAFSVFPHLLEEDAGRYLEEARRVLRVGGRVVTSFFVLDDGSRAAIAAGAATFPFLDPQAHVAVVSDDLPEEAVAYDRRWIAARLATEIEVHEGTWRGGEAETLLDIVVARA